MPRHIQATNNLIKVTDIAIKILDKTVTVRMIDAKDYDMPLWHRRYIGSLKTINHFSGATQAIHPVSGPYDFLMIQKTESTRQAVKWLILQHILYDFDLPESPIVVIEE